MTHEREGDHLLALLRQRWGDEPAWTLRPNGQYGFYLHYHRELVPIGDVRRLIEDTFGFANGPSFIIGDLEEQTQPANGFDRDPGPRPG